MNSFNVTKDDYGSHLDQALTHDRVLWENNGWGIRSTRGSGDTLLWTSPYQLRSRKEGPFMLDTASLVQTMLVHVDYSAEPDRKKRMNDNDFYTFGWNGQDDLLPADRLEIAEDGASSVWSIGNMRYTAAPPHWFIRGEDHGIGYDISLEASAPGFWMTDPRKTALETGDRWLLAYAKAEGTLDLFGKERIGLSGMGWHERHIHLSNTYNPAQLLKGEGVVFHNGYSDDLQVILMARPELGIYRGSVVTSDGIFEFKGQSSIALQTENRWHDPRSGFLIPSVWSIRMESDEAELRLDVCGFARAYYLWSCLKDGVNVLYWWLAESQGELIEKATGKRRTIVNMKHVVHNNRAFYHYPPCQNNEGVIKR